MFSTTSSKTAAAVVMVLAGAAAQAEPAIVDAAMNGDLKTVRALVREAADVNAAQPDGMTALHWAVQRRDLAMIDVLLGGRREARPHEPHGREAAVSRGAER